MHHRHPSPASIVETAIWRFAQDGLQTPTTEITKNAYISNGYLFRAFPTKQALLEACYAYTVAQLAAPLHAAAGQARPDESLRAQLWRWWMLPAKVALAKQEVFDFWRLYRTRPRKPGGTEPLLGPFAPVPTLVERALVAAPPALQSVVSLPRLGSSLAGQWTAALDTILSDPMCRGQHTLQGQLIGQAYQAWWQSLGISELVPAVFLPPEYTTPGTGDS
jgi:AcrR family transcriptional regulator